jgi:hypothetical protein
VYICTAIRGGAKPCGSTDLPCSGEKIDLGYRGKAHFEQRKRLEQTLKVREAAINVQQAKINLHNFLKIVSGTKRSYASIFKTIEE